MISLETMLTIKEEFAETISFEKILLKKFLFQFKTNATSMMFGYAMFFTPLIACWSLITNRDRIIMFVNNHIVIRHDGLAFAFFLIVCKYCSSTLFCKLSSLCVKASLPVIYRRRVGQCRTNSLLNRHKQLY